MKPVKRNYVCGVAHKDITKVGNTPSYNMWRRIIGRCYRESDLIQRPCYVSCDVCKEWFTFSNFDKWYNEHCVDGWEIDKDLLSNGLKCYSPETCCFLPKELNAFLSSLTERKKNVLLSTGVTLKKGKYYAQIKYYKKTIHLGVFNTLEEAEKAYKMAKKERLYELIEKYGDKLELRVFQQLCALMCSI